MGMVMGCYDGYGDGYDVWYGDGYNDANGDGYDDGYQYVIQLNQFDLYHLYK